MKRSKEIDDIEEMVNEKKRETRDLTREMKLAKEEVENTKIFEPRKEEIKEEIKEKITVKKNKDLNIIGEIDLLCIGYYIYLLLINNYMNDEFNYIIPGCILIFIILLFGISIIVNKKVCKIINIFNLLSIFAFIIYNVYYLI